MKNLFNKAYIFNKKIKYFFILLILFICYFTVCAYSYTSAVSANISNSVFRFHVIANSDSEEDQNLKLLVRDKILEYTNNLITPSMTKNEIVSILEKNSDTLYEIAENVIKENNFNYKIKISFGNFFFPTKSYGDISLPAGYYDGLRIEIGEAKRT